MKAVDSLPQLAPGTKVVARVLGWEEFYEGGPIPEWIMGPFHKRYVDTVDPEYWQYSVAGLQVDPATVYEPADNAT